MSCERVAGGTVIQIGCQSMPPLVICALARASQTSQTHNLAQMVVVNRPDNDGFMTLDGGSLGSGNDRNADELSLPLARPELSM